MPSSDPFDSPLFKRGNTIKARANKMEREVAKKLKVKQQPKSGAGFFNKGDFKSTDGNRKFIGDAKSTKHKSLSVSVDMINKIQEDMLAECGDEWYIPLYIAGELRGVIISPELFNEIRGV